MFSHLKRRIGVLTAVAVLAALVPTLAVSTVSAAPATTATAAGDTTTLSACPTNASIAAAGFTDTTSTDVDCIKYYGITTGVTATTYEPTASVPRWQMALFLTRAATEMGVTLGDGSDQGFTDISGESAAIQTAINQLAQLGVTLGTTATTYDPASNVSREQMALFVRRLLENVTPGPNGSNDDDTDADTAVETYINGATATYNYTDIDTGDITFDGHNSIVEVFNLGITGDAKTVSTFSPAADLTRLEMATWLTNAAAHSNLRPEGLIIQSSDPSDFGDMIGGAVGTSAVDELHISNRDANFDAIGSALVDVFCFETTSVVALQSTWNDTAFTAAGLVNDALRTSAGSTAGTIESSDDLTDASGNIELLQSALDGACSPTDGESVDYYAFTGAVGDIYDNDTTTHTETTVTSSYDAGFVVWSTSHANTLQTAAASVTSSWGTSEIYGQAKYGSDVTVTLQLRRSASAAASKNVARACNIQITEYLTTPNAAADTGDTFGGVSSSIVTHVVTTDAATGSVDFIMSSAEPSASVDNGNRGHVIVIDNAGTANTAAGCPTSWIEGTSDSGVYAADNALALQWDDTARDENSVVMSLASGYVLAHATGTGASNTITATSYDQYGVGIASNSLGMTLTGGGSNRGETVGQNDEGATAITNTFTTTRTTNASGVATWGVSRDSLVSGSSTFRVNDGEDNNDVETMYWTNVSSTTAVGDDATNSVPATFAADTDYGSVTSTGEVGGQIVGLDAANDLLIVEIIAYSATTSAADSRFVQYSYDSNDQFTLNGTASDLLRFESYVGLGFDLTSNTVGTDSRLTAVDPLDDATSSITTAAESLTSAFTIDTDT